MLQVTGHGKDVFDQQYQAAVTEFINREKKCIKRWEMKYKPMFEKKWKEHKKRYLNKPQRVGRTIGRIQSTSEPTVRCIGWGVTKLDKRTADKEIARGGLSHYNDGEEYFNKEPESKRSVHGRTKALSTAFYDTNGIYSFGGEVIRKQGKEIDKCHDREMLRIDNLRRRMGMYEDGQKIDNETAGEEEGDELLEPNLSDVSDPIEDLDDIEEEEEIAEQANRESVEMKKKSIPVVVPDLDMDKVSQKSGRSTQRSTQRSSKRSSRRQSSRSTQEEKKETVFQRARRARKGKKKQKISAFNSYGNPLFPRFSSDTPRSTTSSTKSSARRKKGRNTPRHEEIMRRLESQMEKKQVGGMI